MELREYCSLDELRALLDKEIAGDRRERPENNFLENTLRIALAEEYTDTRLQVFGFPAAEPQYFFFVEYSEIQYAYIHCRRPLSGHDATLLEQSVPLIIRRFASLLTSHGQLLVVGDQTFGDAFERHLSSELSGERFVTTHASQTGVFYMTPEQRQRLMKMPCDAPPGFSFERVNVERDGDEIHRLWKNGISAEITKNRLRCLPSLCALSASSGAVAGWAMSARFGQISNLFMLPEYRGRGAGVALELSLAKLYARRGMRVFKYVERSNAAVYEGTLKSPLWTLWTDRDGDNNDRPNFNYFRKFERAE